ncbi:transport and Golgi organization protein 1 homolog isoform X12 [Lutra lutra]|uniref:transport and Golgi organization protein 1 homolog isoform X12 n=1 Tax=Lutra lutra TaxID=9657 RepID=UPI001FD4681A|nr:transport and Golgi organization protein 1 homolog isoform X12 [Lutra lutra]
MRHWISEDTQPMEMMTPVSMCSQHVASSCPPHSYGHGHGHSPFTEGNEHRATQQIKPRQYEVTLEQIKMKINDLKKENSVLEENIASCEEKAQDELGDQELRAFTSKNQELKERKKFLEDQRNSLSSQKTAKEAELNLLKKKVDMVVEFSEKRKLTAEEKLEEILCEFYTTKNELFAADEKLKLTEEEMDKYRQEVEEMEDQLLEAELTFNHKIAVQERNAVANWMKARYWETRMMQQSRENAYLKYRLRMMEGETLPVGSMWRGPMPRRPELQEPVWQGREHDGKRSS